MPNLTVRASDDLLDALDTEADDRGISRAEHVRRLLHDRHESDERVAALESELDECQNELERARRERRQVLDQRDEHTELVRAVEERRDLEARRASAGVLTRARYWLFGMDDD